MLVKFSPENQETPSVWEFHPEKVKQSAAELIERRSGMTYAHWAKAVGDGSALARKVLLWHLMTRDGHPLRIEDVPDFYFGDLSIEPSLDELRRVREQVESSTEIAQTEKVDALNAIDLEIAKLLGRPDSELAPEDLGKAASPDGD